MITVALRTIDSVLLLFREPWISTAVYAETGSEQHHPVARICLQELLNKMAFRIGLLFVNSICSIANRFDTNNDMIENMMSSPCWMI